MGEPDEKDPTFRVIDRRGAEKEAETPKMENPSPPKRPSGAQPKIDFSNFLLSMSTSALMHLGLIEEPESRKTKKDLVMAKHEIDIVEMLNEKTKGNLTPQEAELMESALYELRMRFVEASK